MGEPVDCRRQKRLFVVGNEGASDYFDFVSYKNDVLIIGNKGRKAEQKDPKKDQIAIWLGCE
jgi:hypothetical protein